MSISYGRQSIDAADIRAVVATLRSDFLTQGPKVREFENALCEYTGAKYAVVVSSGTAALHISVLALDIKPADEVITSPITFLASANCALYAGASVRFADIEPDTALIDPIEITGQLTKRTKVIIPVHFAGQSCDMERLSKLTRKHDLFVIEDAAHAIGSKYKGEKVGSCRYSDMTVFSFHPVKTITTGEGGAITTNNRRLYERLLMLRSHGVTKDARFMTGKEGDWYYDMQMLGFNYRLTDIQAALGISQLKKIEKFTKRRREIVELYRKEFADDPKYSMLDERNYSQAAFHLFPLLIDFAKAGITKRELFEELKKKGLHLQVHYIPVHLQSYYRKLGFRKGQYPKAEAYYESAVSLPLYPRLRNCDVKDIAGTIKELLR